MDLPECHGRGEGKCSRGRLLKCEVLTGADAAWGDDAPVPAGQGMFGNVGGHALTVETVVNFPARIAWLANLQSGIAETKDVADADAVFIKLGAGNIFAEAAGNQLGCRIGKAFGEPGIVACRVKMYGFFRPAMNTAISLFVTDEAFRAQFKRNLGGLLEHAGGSSGIGQGGNAADVEGDLCHGLQIVPSIPQPGRTADPRGIPIGRRHDFGI